MAKFIGRLLEKFTSKTGSAKTTEKAAPKVQRTSEIVTAKDWISTGKWVNVSSSNVKGIKYDFVYKILYVQFLGKGNPDPIYAYHGVPQGLAKDMFNAPSMGKFVWRKLRDKFTFYRI